MKFLVFAITSFFALLAPAQNEFAPITREELSHAYLRFDKLLHQNPQSPQRMVELNRAFDAVSMQFFSFQLAAAASALNELSLSLLPPDMDLADKNSYRIAWSLATELSPADLRTDSPDPAIILRGMYAVKITSPVSIWTELASADTSALNVKPIIHKLQVSPDGSIALRLPLNDVFAGRENLAITLTFSADELVETRRFLVPRSDPAVFAKPYANKLATLKNVKGKDPGYTRAQAIYAERLKIYSGSHSSTNSSQFLLNPKIHDRQVYQELKLLTSGINPYRNRSGDIWRPIISSRPNSPSIPCRVYVPADIPPRDPATAGAPLIIALHGAGGDESMFMDAYGNGEIKRLADEFHFIVASPSTNYLLSNRPAISELIDQLAEDYHIDRARIYIIGHSLGASLASAFAIERASQLAAVVCIAGGEFPTAPNSPLAPTLVYGAQLDPIVPADPLTKRAAAAKAAGIEVEFRLVENQGHTLIVAAKLRESVEWLLTHTLKQK